MQDFKCGREIFMKIILRKKFEPLMKKAIKRMMGYSKATQAKVKE